jgi:uncharacterized membrane protein
MQTQTTSGEGGTATEAGARQAVTRAVTTIGQILGQPKGNGHNGPGDRRPAQGLGLFSIGLGLAQITAAAALSKLVLGADDKPRRRAMRAVGVREVAAGLSLLARPGSAPFLWTRVVGDAVDLALLGLSLKSKKSRSSHVSAAAVVVLGLGVLDVLANRRSRRDGTLPPQSLRVLKSITIGRDPEDVYRFWHNLANLARFMGHLEFVEVRDAQRSHWRVRGPAGQSIEWDAEITEDVPNEKIAWQSTGDAVLPNRGQVRFVPAPGGRGTQVILETEYQPRASAAGAVGAAIAKLFALGPEVMMLNDLRRCKQLLELGEVVHSDASIARGLHPARPAARRVQGGGR